MGIFLLAISLLLPSVYFYMILNIYFSAFREFLVDLMAAPGTLIPVDVPSAKDSTYRPYNPDISKVPARYPLNNTGVPYLGQKPFLGEGSSQNPMVESSSIQDRRPRPTESLPTTSGSSIDNSVGSSRVSNKATPSNQFDNFSSSAIGNYKGTRGAHAVDSVRMNVNVVPYQNQEDPKNLFADLNPFQIKGPGKNSVYNKTAESKVDELQRPRNNLVSGRPPVPLMWKNRYACNEVPKKKESDYLESLFPRINREPNDYNMSSLASTSSSSEKINTDGFKSSGNTSTSGKSNDEKNSEFNSSSLLAKRTTELNKMTLGDVQNTSFKEEDPKDPKDLQTDWIYVNTEGESNEIGLNDRRKCTHDRFMETSLKLKAPEGPCSSVDSGTNRIDQVFDDVDVGQCEIPWEDLVIGERIGLGNAFYLASVAITTYKYIYICLLVIFIFPSLAHYI